MRNARKLRFYHRCLRWLLTIDGAVLFFLGAFLIAAPKQVEAIFRFKDLPQAVSYIIGLWGCVLLMTGVGYLAAAGNPRRHIIWVQVGFGRNLLETVVGLVYVGRGIVTAGQAGGGIVFAALLTVAYLVFYPRSGPPMELHFDEPPARALETPASKP